MCKISRNPKELCMKYGIALLFGLQQCLKQTIVKTPKIKHITVENENF